MALAALIVLGQAPVFALFAVGDRWPETAYWLPGAACIAVNIVASVLFLLALRVSDLSRTIPMLALTPVFAGLTAIPLLGEVPTPLQWLGIAGIVAGAMALNPPRSVDKGVLAMLGVAALWALGPVLDKVCMQSASVPMHAAVQMTGIGGGLLLLLLLRGRARDLLEIRRSPGIYLATLAVGLVALGLQLLALKLVLVSLVEGLKRAVGLASSVVVGRLSFGEAITARKVIGVLAMIAGSAAMAA